MTYQVLARKYRPRQFDDVVAQEHVTRTLKNAVGSGRLSSGYLFTGPRGTGKTTTARILAKALNCVNGPTPTPCDNCPACQEITAGSSLDVLEIDAASNTGVDDIRTLRENVRYMPTSGKKRIYIIDEVHRLSGSAFDALLKTLEEPPEHVVFILATTEPFKVPETIRSRTQRYDFRRVNAPALSAHLRHIAGMEKIEIDDEALFILARKADGSIRDSLSLLDQLSAFSSEKITAKLVTEALGLVDREFYYRYVEIVAAKNSAGALDMVKELIDSGIEIGEFTEGLVEYFRNLLILQQASKPEQILELSDNEIEQLRRQAGYFSTGDLLRMIKVMTDLIVDLKAGIEPRLLLETNTLKLTGMESTVHFEDILAYLAGAQEGSSEEFDTDLFGLPKQKKPPESMAVAAPDETSAERPCPPEDILAGGRAANLPIVQSSWPKFVDFLKGQSHMLSAHLAMAEIREVRDNTILAVFHNSGGTYKQIVEKPNYLSVITTALRDFYKTNLKIKFEVDYNKAAAPEPATKMPSRPEKIDSEKLLQEDEKLRRLVEQVDGEIIGKQKAEE
jgi:DNA polymerase-3 subunit gamma/tau